MNAHTLAAAHPELAVVTLRGGIASWVHDGQNVVDHEGTVVKALHSGADTTLCG